MNRDTLYSAAVFDLDAGPVTITLPDPGKRFLSMQVIDEDEYTPEVHYGAAVRTLTKDEIGTRYALVGVRILVNPDDPKDVETVHALQDAIEVSQPGGPGKFTIPNWDASSQIKVRNALLELASTIPDTKGMFGPRGQVDPVRHLVGSAAAWGGNPEQDALYLNVTPPKNDGKTVYKLNVKNVPVDGFWSISVYDDKGYFAPNAQNAYSLNNLTAKPGDDGSFAIQFGGCDGRIANCLPTPPAMELSGAPLSAEARDPERRVDLSGAAGGAIIRRRTANRGCPAPEFDRRRPSNGSGVWRTERVSHRPRRSANCDIPPHSGASTRPRRSDRRRLIDIFPRSSMAKCAETE